MFVRKADADPARLIGAPYVRAVMTDNLLIVGVGPPFVRFEKLWGQHRVHVAEAVFFCP